MHHSTLSDDFISDHPCFSLKETVFYPNGGKSFFLVFQDICVILDEHICDIEKGQEAFPYMLITEKQNQYVHNYRSVYRFLGYKKELVDPYLEGRNPDAEVKVRKIYDRSDSAEVSPLENEFENSFTNVYGMESLQYLSREYGINDAEGHNYFIDYTIRTNHGTIGVEENGRSYHHPQLIGKEGYERQLHKQNTCTLRRIKLYRFSIEDLGFTDRMEDDIRSLLGDDTQPGDFIEIDGIRERVEKITQVAVGTFEDQYGDYLSEEQLAREYFVSTGTITSWIKKGKIVPSVTYPFGSRKIYLFSPESVEKYRKELNLKVHDDETIRDDFLDFLAERDYSLSYKMPFVLGLLHHLNADGDAEIDEILDEYIAFYQDRIDKGLPADRKTCPYNAETLKDRKAIKRSMLTNPFEKFERKRFLYYSKDLGMISVNHALWDKMTEQDWKQVEEQMRSDLKDYYQNLQAAEK